MKKRPGRPAKRTEPPARITMSVEPAIKDKLIDLANGLNTSMTRVIETLVNEAHKELLK